MEHAHHPGTQGVYSKHWDGWVRWCADHSVPPHNPSSCDLANFLAFLSCDKGLSESSVKVHRSAVCTTICQMGGPTFSDNPLLRDLVRGAALAEAKSPNRTLSWDLFLVLSALRLPPYEPLKQCSLKHLTLKTAFLVSLASDRRCCEVHALRGSPETWRPSQMAPCPCASCQISWPEINFQAPLLLSPASSPSPLS